MRILYLLSLVVFTFSCAKVEISPITATLPVTKKKLTTSILPEGSGKITPASDSYDLNESVQMTASPIGDYLFKEWQNGLTGSSNPTKLIMDSDKSVTALFEPKKYPTSKFYEKHTSVNQKTGWYQTNKSFVGNFWIDSSLTVKNLFVDNAGKILFGSYIPNIQGYFSNRQTLLYTDFNGDGKNDVLNVYWPGPFGTNKPGYYATWEFDKNGFNSPKTIEGLTAARKLIINDYFGDNKKSVLVSSSGVDKPPFPGDYLQILSLESDLSIKLKNINQVIGYFHTGASGDIDGDGDVDILMYSGGGQSKMGPVYFENVGNGNFKYNANLIIGLNYIEGNPNNYYTIELFDVNTDGFLDLILGGSGNNILNRILWGSASHTFSTANQTILPKELNYSGVMDIAFSDMDSDGDIDIFLLSEIDYQGFGIQILENQNGKFIDVSNLRMDIAYKKNALWFGWIRVFDIDGDGDQDLVGDGYGYFNLDKIPVEKQPVPKIYWINDGKGNYKSSFSY